MVVVEKKKNPIFLRRHREPRSVFSYLSSSQLLSRCLRVCISVFFSKSAMLSFVFDASKIWSFFCLNSTYCTAASLFVS